MSSESSAEFFPGLILGAIVGAVIALLYAPQPGIETRQLVRDKALDIKEKVAKTVSCINESADSAVKGED